MDARACAEGEATAKQCLRGADVALLQDDSCNSDKHTLGKKANLISKGLRVCCKKSDKEYTVIKTKKLGKNMMFILKDPEGNRLDPMPAEQLLKGYRLD